MKSIVCAFVCVFLTLPLFAQTSTNELGLPPSAPGTVSLCELNRGDLETLPHTLSKTFRNGNKYVTAAYTTGPEASPLIVVATDETRGESSCFAVTSAADSREYTDLVFERLSVVYDSDFGLRLLIPLNGKNELLNLRVDQTGDVTEVSVEP